MPVQTTRSGRTVKSSSSKQEKLDALEILARQRRGEKVEIAIKEDEPLFDEVDEETYRRTRKGGFVVDPDSEEDEYDEDDLDFIDDGEDEYEVQEPTKKGRRGRQPKEVEADPRQKSLKSFLGAGSSKSGLLSSSASIMKPERKQPQMDSDDILSQMLFDVPTNTPGSAVKKPLTRLKPLPRLTPTQSTRPTASQSTTPARKIAAPQDTPAKKQRVASPIDAMVDDSSLFSEEAFELAAANNSAIYDKMDTQESELSLEPEPDTSGIEVAPLDADTKSNLKFLQTENGRQYTHFYWLDCCEGPTQGTVYFFGRIQVPNNKFVSCCVVVKNVYRAIYLLIKPNCTYEETVAEFTQITSKTFKIKNFTCRKETKRFAFDAEVPPVAEYVRVEYPATQQALPLDLAGETFSKVLNIKQSPMERLILELKLRGPAWLRLIEPMASSPQITWTRIELVLESPANLVVEENPSDLSRPYFCVLSLALQTYPHPNTPGRNDIVAISAMMSTCFRLDECRNRKTKGVTHFLMMAKPPATQKDTLRLPHDFQRAVKTFRRTQLDVSENERDLLIKFMEKFSQLDPDIVVGHDLLNFDFETLVKQMAINKVGAWDKLGRFKRNTLPSSKKAFPYLFSGRVLCDIKKSAEELMQLRSYDLTELASKILDFKRVEYNHVALMESYKSSESLLAMLTAVWQDVDCISSILVELSIIPLALKITNITGNILSRTLAAGRSERNEYLLLHAFHEDNFICPDKMQNWEMKKAGGSKNMDGGDEPVEVQGRRKAAYTGGLVLEPKAGFYETCILLMDFNSLYPSIIQEFNICFTTVKVPTSDEESAAEVPNESVEIGVLPAQLKQLVSKRREVKAKMSVCKDPMQTTLLDIEQRALKLTANSMYGCLGFEYSRFYAKHLASLVTSKGREILMRTKAIVEKNNHEVIYGDTDSLMIDTKLAEFDEVLQRGSMIKQEIDRQFKVLRIDVDGVYQPLLLLKKKNYAGASLSKTSGGAIVKKVETKGLDSVRRDRAVVAKEAGEKILSMIMGADKEISETVQNIHAYLKELSELVNKDELPREKYLISKQLNKNPEEYRDTKGIGHVTIALRLNSDPNRARKLRAGDVIEYVICTDESSESANQRGYTLEEMSTGGTALKIDKDYYLCQQIYPAVSRICDKLPFTNAYAIAEAMGIESSSSIKIPRDSNIAVMKDQLVSRGEKRFESCEPLVIECPSCTHEEKIRTRTRKAKSNNLIYSLVECSNCNQRFCHNMKKVVIQVIGHIRRLTHSLYNTRFACPDCEYSTRNIFEHLNAQDRPVCPKCSAPLVPDMDDRLMDLQLSFFKHLLDIQKDDAQVEKLNDVERELYEKCFIEVREALKMSFSNTIDAQTVLSMVCSAA